MLAAKVSKVSPKIAAWTAASTNARRRCVQVVAIVQLLCNQTRPRLPVFALKSSIACLNPGQAFLTSGLFSSVLM